MRNASVVTDQLATVYRSCSCHARSRHCDHEVNAMLEIPALVMNAGASPMNSTVPLAPLDTRAQTDIPGPALDVAAGTRMVAPKIVPGVTTAYVPVSYEIGLMLALAADAPGWMNHEPVLSAPVKTSSNTPP